MHSKQQKTRRTGSVTEKTTIIEISCFLVLVGLKKALKKRYIAELAILITLRQYSYQANECLEHSHRKTTLLGSNTFIGRASSDPSVSSAHARSKQTKLHNYQISTISIKPSRLTFCEAFIRQLYVENRTQSCSLANRVPTALTGSRGTMLSHM